VTGRLSTLILAAGEGTRMRSSTPKVLHPIAGRPLVEHAVRAAAGLAPESLVVVVGHGRDVTGSGVSAEVAFDRLTRMSQTENIKLHLVAERMVEEAARRALARHRP